MKAKNLLALALVAAVVLILSLVLQQTNRSQWGADSAAVGAPLLADLPINDIAEINITGPDQSVTLARRQGKWRVLQRYGYPADWNQISQTVKQLANETIKQTIAVAPPHYERLELLPPDTKPADKAGTSVELLNADGESLARLRLGKQHMADSDAAQNPMMRGRAAPDGRYILLHGDTDNADRQQVALVSNPFNTLVPDPTQWLNTQFLDIRNITSARLERDGEILWQLQTDPDSDKLTPAGEVPQNMTINNRAVSETARALGYARIGDVADPDLPDSETGMDNPAVFHAVNKHHVACTIKVGAKTGNNYYVQAKVTYREPDTSADDDSKSGSEEQAPNHDEIPAKIRKLNDLLDGWTYLIPQQTASKLIRPRNDFLKKVENENNEDANAENAQPPPPSPPPTPTQPPVE